MGGRIGRLRCGVFGALALSCLVASAQTGLYQCRDATGTYTSVRPCAARAGVAEERPGAQTRLTAYGSLPTGQVYRGSGRTPSQAKAQEFLSYMSPACSEISEAIRTGPARGVGHSTVAELRTEYQVKCAEEERAARANWNTDQRAARDQRQSQSRAEEVQRASGVRDQQVCREMHQLLLAKQQRSVTLSPAEQAELQRSQALFNTRCLGR